MLADSSNGLDAVTYFFANSGLFFLVTALLFFGFGTLFGAATWGRYKRRYEKSEEIIEANRAELAQLKRRLAEREKGGRATAAAQPTVFTPPSFNPPAVLSPLAALVRGQGRPLETPEIRAFPALSAFPPGKGFSMWTETGWEPGFPPVVVPPSSAFTLWTQANKGETAVADFPIHVENEGQNLTLRSHAHTLWTDHHWKPHPIHSQPQPAAHAFSLWTLPDFLPLGRGAQIHAQAFSLWTEPSWSPPKISGLPPRSARSFSLWTEDDFVPSGRAAVLPSQAWAVWTAEDWVMPMVPTAPQISSAAFSLWTEAGWEPVVREEPAKKSKDTPAEKTLENKAPQAPARGLFSRLFGAFKAG